MNAKFTQLDSAANAADVKLQQLVDQKFLDFSLLGGINVVEERLDQVETELSDRLVANQRC